MAVLLLAEHDEDELSLQALAFARRARRPVRRCSIGAGAVGPAGRAPLHVAEGTRRATRRAPGRTALDE